jgi:protein SDA1
MKFLDDEERDTDVVNEGDIVGYRPKKKLTREERLQSVLAGREGRNPFNKPKEKGGGSTDQDKLKNKPHMMIKHKRGIKAKVYGQAMSDKQKASVKQIKGLKKAAAAGKRGAKGGKRR